MRARRTSARGRRRPRWATKSFQLATKNDLELSKQELRAEMREMREELIDRMDQLERTMWRLAMLGFAMWSATFGALMYAVFG